MVPMRHILRVSQFQLLSLFRFQSFLNRWDHPKETPWALLEKKRFAFLVIGRAERSTLFFQNSRITGQKYKLTKATKRKILKKSVTASSREVPKYSRKDSCALRKKEYQRFLKKNPEEESLRSNIETDSIFSRRVAENVRPLKRPEKRWRFPLGPSRPKTESARPLFEKRLLPRYHLGTY